jgi:predicted nucleic acid-binding Zn ribbon protein
VIHGIHDPGPRFCPVCGTEGSMRKALSTPAVVFKGSGWAKVDRRSSGGSRAAVSGRRASGSTGTDSATGSTTSPGASDAPAASGEAPGGGAGAGGASSHGASGREATTDG